MLIADQPAQVIVVAFVDEARQPTVDAPERRNAGAAKRPTADAAVPGTAPAMVAWDPECDDRPELDFSPTSIQKRIVRVMPELIVVADRQTTVDAATELVMVAADEAVCLETGIKVQWLAAEPVVVSLETSQVEARSAAAVDLDAGEKASCVCPVTHEKVWAGNTLARLPARFRIPPKCQWDQAQFRSTSIRTTQREVHVTS